MIIVSSEAIRYMKELLDQEENVGNAVRIGIVGAGRLGVHVDNPDDDDERFDRDGITLIINRNLLSYCKKVEISFTDSESDDCGKNGYVITTEVPL